MVELKKGEIYDAKFVRSGEGGNGAWRLIALKDDRTRKEITIWAENPDTCGVEQGGKFRVDEILSVKLSARKDKNDVWHDTISANAKVCAVAGMQTTLADITADDDGELPF